MMRSLEGLCLENVEVLMVSTLKLSKAHSAFTTADYLNAERLRGLGIYLAYFKSQAIL